MSRKVIVTGATGMDGSHMVDFLLQETDYEIYGLIRRLSTPNYIHLQDALKNPRFHEVRGDLSDASSIYKAVENIKPDYFINFAGQSHVHDSWDVPEQTFDVNATGVLRCLEAIIRYVPNCRYYNAGSSEELGNVQYSPQDEKHPPRSRSPYAASKAAARQLIKSYRESYNLYAIQGTLFNHEGKRRGEKFVTSKITKGVANIFNQIKNNKEIIPIELGNLYSKRDWSYAPDFIDGIWRMLNQEKYNPKLKEKLDIFHGDLHITGPFQIVEKIDCTNYKSDEEFLSRHIKDYVLASGETHTIKEFIELAFSKAGFECYWEGNGINEVYYVQGVDLDISTNYKWSANLEKIPVVKINPKFYRPAEVELLLGDSSLARKELGWSPKVSFDQLVEIMVKNDLQKLAI